MGAASARLETRLRDEAREARFPGVGRLRPKGLAADVIQAAYEAGFEVAQEALGVTSISQQAELSACRRRYCRRHADAACEHCWGSGYTGSEACDCVDPPVPEFLQCEPAKPRCL